jgi:hypothetical protein
MTSPVHTNSHDSSERTPLLSYNGPGDYAGNDSAIQLDEDDIQAAKVAGQGGLEPGQFPEFGTRRSYSHSHWLAPDEDANGRPEPEEAAQFQENGLLSGVSRTKFRCIFGGILLGYFVSLLPLPRSTQFPVTSITIHLLGIVCMTANGG